MLATVIFIPIMLHTMRGADKLRILDFSTQNDESSQTGANVLTSGRFEIWQMHIAEMDTLECLIGRGFRRRDYNRLGRVSAGNAHSAVMTVFYNSGVVGLFLLFIVLVQCVRMGFKLGDRGRMALLFVGTWFMSGMAESLPVQGGVSGVLAGLGMGLLCKTPRNSELMTEQEKICAYGGYGQNWSPW